MSQTSLVYSNEKHSKTQPRVLKFRYDITGAKTSTSVPVGADALVTYDAIAAQSTIDNYLGTSSEFLIAAFDATAMGADELGLIINMRGQCAKVLGAKITLFAEAGTLSISLNSKAVSALTASTVENSCAVGASGNIAVKFTGVTGLDAATDGYYVVEIDWIAK